MDDIESIHAGHADVEEDEVGVDGAGELDGFGSGCTFAGHLAVGLIAKKAAQLLAREYFVIGENNLDGHRPKRVNGSVSIAWSRSGIWSVTWTWPAPISRMASDPSSP